MNAEPLPERSDAPQQRKDQPSVGRSVCSCDAADLRGAQCTDAEIKAHMFMHSKGLCPIVHDECAEEYAHMVGVFERAVHA